jgi:hypothetical protein
MKKARKKARRITVQEWFYLGCLVLGGTLGVIAVSIMASRPPPEHPSKLLEAPGVVPWYTLTKVSFMQRDGKSALQFADRINELDGKPVKLRGYITPLQLGSDQKHFILSPKPPSCAFCIPAGPDEMVEVFSKTPVKYSLEPVTVSGTFAVLRSDPGGMFYRMADAAPVSSEGRL